MTRGKTISQANPTLEVLQQLARLLARQAALEYSLLETVGAGDAENGFDQHKGATHEHSARP